MKTLAITFCTVLALSFAACDSGDHGGPDPVTSQLSLDGKPGKVDCSAVKCAGCPDGYRHAPTGKDCCRCLPDNKKDGGSECSTASDCEGLIHIMCVGSWSCDAGACSYACDSGGVSDSGEPCGPTTCATDEVCCNASCGICTPPGGLCTMQVCSFE